MQIILLTKSKAAIFRLLDKESMAKVDPGFGSYLPMSRLFLTVRQVIFSGSLLDVGVKKLATAFSEIYSQQNSLINRELSSHL